MSKGLTIIIGNKNYSSWSFRGWLAVRLSGRPFEEIRLPMDTDHFRHNILKYSPTGKVPVLHHGDRIIWDSLAICEYMADEFPDYAARWPTNPAAKAHAKCVSAEMHSGFPQVRSSLPMNIRRTFKQFPIKSEIQTEVDRICTLWNHSLEAFSGPWLYGDRISIADIMFVPVVMRFRTYAIALNGRAQTYVNTVLQHEAVQEWIAAACEEKEIIAHEEMSEPI